MLKQNLILEVKKDEKSFRLEISHNTTYGELYDVLTEMRMFIIKRINEENESSKTKAEEKPPEQE